MIGCHTKITHLSPDEFDTSRIPALARQGVDGENTTTLSQMQERPSPLEAAPWVLTLSCGTDYVLYSTASAEDYAQIGGASTLAVHMRTEYLPLAMVQAIEHLLSRGTMVWLVFHTVFTLSQRPLIYTLYRLGDVPANDWSHLTIEQFPGEGIARVYMAPDGDPQLLVPEER